MSPRKSENPDFLSSAVADRANRLSPSGIRKFFDLLASMDDVISLGVGEPDYADDVDAVAEDDSTDGDAHAESDATDGGDSDEDTTSA